MEDLSAWLSGPDAPPGIDRVLSPAVGDEQTRASLTSPDGQVALVLVRFGAVGPNPTTKEAIAAISDRLEQAPPDMKVYLTGDGPILAAYNDESQGSLDSTTWITIVLVVAILLIIYRSPVSPIIPLATIGLAYVISRGVVAFLGSGPLTISMYTNVFLIVVLFGAGTDYCLFLISRFREEMSDVNAAAPAVKTTVRTIGETIASSAGTVIVGLAMMAAAELGLYNTTGPSIAIGVAIALLAGLTFTPALLTVLGHYAFWPRKPRRIGRAWPVARLVGEGGRTAVDSSPRAGDSAGAACRLRRRPRPRLRPAGRPAQGRRDQAGVRRAGRAPRPRPDAAPQRGGCRPRPFRHPRGTDAASQNCRRLLLASPHVTAVRSFTGSLPDEKTLSVADQLGVQAQTVRQGLATLEAMAGDPDPGGGSGTGGSPGAGENGGNGGG